MWCANGKPLEIDRRGFVVCGWKALRNKLQGVCGERKESLQKYIAVVMWCAKGKPFEIDSCGDVVYERKDLCNR
jgi:hypothetical protein